MNALLSKTRFVAGWQCHKQLWWRVHEPDAPGLAPDETLAALLEQSQQVGERAREYVPGGVLINLPISEIAARVAATAQALRNDAAAIYEASFIEADVFVSIDILQRLKRGYALIEVKATNGLKDEHLPDAALQACVARRAGLDLRRVEVMHLNRECVYPDLSNLFVREDVTEAVEALLPAVEAALKAQRAVLAGPLPDIAIGAHCTQPRECPFLARCWPPAPPHHLRTLFRARKDKLAEWAAQGYATIHDLPDSVKLSGPAERQRRAVRQNQRIVERGLAAALAPLRPPLAFLDFETVALPIPVWNGCSPYTQAPVQFSLHRDDAAHFEWMADGPDDPRPALAEALVAACGDAQTVIAYNTTFEQQCLQHLAEAVPARAEALRALAARLFDLLPVVRENVYHPDFNGSFSLKSVIPALLPELSYTELEVSSGEAASRLLAQLMFEPEAFAANERAELRAHLLRYCEQDTWVMVRLLDYLRALA
jgi:hypothetical protein